MSNWLRGMGVDHLLPSAPVKLGVPVSASTPDDRVCPGCKTFETDEPGAEFCPRCIRIRGNRLARADELRRHDEGVRREIEGRRS